MPHRIFFEFASFLLIGMLVSCSSGGRGVRDSEAPAWTHQPSRTVDSGYLVYVGTGEDGQLERAVFKAESMAIADMANECTLVPKGTRVEDRYTQVTGSGHRAFAKIGIVFEECEAAKKAIQPAEIRAVANVAMTEQLKKYQDLYYSGEAVPPTEKPAGTPTELPTAPASGNVSVTGGVVVIRDYPDYFIARQSVVYVKQEVVLAPVTFFRPGAPETIRFLNTATPASNQIQQYEKMNPTVKANPPGTWSSIQSDPRVNLPSNLRHLRREAYPAPLTHPLASPRPMRSEPEPRGRVRGRRRHRW